ncbi:hypothetical protein CDAR_257881 [Caerostris darwini]|uniref:Ribosomal protein L20 n=1 Tax=Caerostris darwini TaxID=1538125 RepID=A0AAV4WXR0_9ARAC|nr:hypothetical protein CDAR_257881 [Caerostris darwini]
MVRKRAFILAKRFIGKVNGFDKMLTIVKRRYLFLRYGLTTLSCKRVRRTRVLRFQKRRKTAGVFRSDLTSALSCTAHLSVLGVLLSVIVFVHKSSGLAQDKRCRHHLRHAGTVFAFMSL